MLAHTWLKHVDTCKALMAPAPMKAAFELLVELVRSCIHTCLHVTLSLFLCLAKPVSLDSALPAGVRDGFTG